MWASQVSRRVTVRGEPSHSTIQRFGVLERGTPVELRPVAGEIESEQRAALEVGLPVLFVAMRLAHLWEPVVTPPTG